MFGGWISFFLFFSFGAFRLSFFFFSYVVAESLDAFLSFYEM